jgi:SHAQKYF class myb-like DNA-binding protein
MAAFWAFYAMLLIKVALTGVPWTEEEHRRFLLGLQKLGKGDWRGISHNFVVSRTPTQVASHAQKYFIRQSSTMIFSRNFLLAIFSRLYLF